MCGLTLNNTSQFYCCFFTFLRGQCSHFNISENKPTQNFNSRISSTLLLGIKVAHFCSAVRVQHSMLIHSSTSVFLCFFFFLTYCNVHSVLCAFPQINFTSCHCPLGLSIFCILFYFLILAGRRERKQAVEDCKREIAYVIL